MRRVVVGLSLLLVVWLAAGIRQVDPQSFAVAHGPGLGRDGRLVQPGWTLAPPGLYRLHIYPSVGVEISLPDAARAQLPARDGSRFGMRGWVTLTPRPEQWSKIDAAAAGGGIDALLVDAVRAAASELPAGIERGPLTPTLRRDLERRIRAALSDRGVDLRRLDIDSFDLLTVTSAESEIAEETKVLVVGLDGGDWAIVDQLLEQGKLPNLQRIIDNGVRAKLLSISPMLSPVIWTSMATGVEPSRHGILDFLVEDPQSGSRQPVTSAQRQVPTMWEMLSRAGVDVGIVGWWATWPADPVRGYLISDRIAYQLFDFKPDPTKSQGKSWPPELYDEIRDSIRAPESVEWSEVQPYLSGARTEEGQFDAEEREMLQSFRTLLASGETYVELATTLSERFNPQLEIVYFEGTDTAAHLFMPYRDPQLPGVDKRRFESFRAVVDRYYETADRYLGELLENRGDDWTVMIVSDHGFASDATRPQASDSRIGHGTAAEWHRRFGMLVLSGANVNREATIDEASIFDVAPTILTLFGQPVPKSWPGRVLGGAIEPEFLKRYPVRYRNEDPQRNDAASQGMLDPAAADLMEKLQSLGYISSGEGESADSVTAKNNSGVALMAEGRYADAEADFRAGLVATPGAPMLMVNLGLALRLQGKLDEARTQFERAAGRPETLRMAGHQLAQIDIDEGQLERAERWLRQILEREPDASEVLNTLGRVLEQGGDDAGAMAAFQRSAELDPDAAMPRNNLGNMFKRKEQLAEAERWYLRAIEADPYFMGAYNNLALVYQQRQELDRAIDLYDRALSKAPTNVIVLNNLASLYYARGELHEARELWEQAIESDPSYESPYNNLASIAINEQRFDEAERLLARALEADPNYGDARVNMAIVLGQRGDVAGVREQLQLATNDPRSGLNSRLQLALFELDQGDNAAAIEVLDQIRSIYPPNPAWLNPLGEALLRSGRGDDALIVWRQSLQLQPNQPRLQQIVASPPWQRSNGE